MGRLADFHEEVALHQHGYFTAKQAAQYEMSPQYLNDRLGRGAVEKVEGLRGLWRMRPFPPADDDWAVALYVWSNAEGVISHGSALMLHGLSDHLQHAPHTMTFPTSWKRRSIPASQIEAHFEDLPNSDVQWLGALRLTTPARTLMDFIAHGARPDLARQALEEGRKQKLFKKTDIKNRFDLENS